MQPSKPEKDNTDSISRYNYIQCLRRYLVLYHDISIIEIYCPTLPPIMFISEQQMVHYSADFSAQHCKIQLCRLSTDAGLFKVRNANPWRGKKIPQATTGETTLE